MTDRPVWHQPNLFDAPEADAEDAEVLPPPDRLATSGVVCLTCGADVATGERHSAACDAVHGPYGPVWDGVERDEECAP